MLLFLWVVCQETTQTYINSLRFLVKVLLGVNTRDQPGTHARTALQAPHTPALIWNIVGGAGPAQGSLNSSGATPPFERPKFPFLRSAAWAGSAVLQSLQSPQETAEATPAALHREHGMAGVTRWPLRAQPAATLAQGAARSRPDCLP